MRRKSIKNDDPPSIELLAERVTALEVDVKWIREHLRCLDKKLWYILTGVIISILASILVAVI